jgi:hypothetical protein
LDEISILITAELVLLLDNNIVNYYISKIKIKIEYNIQI